MNDDDQIIVFCYTDVQCTTITIIVVEQFSRNWSYVTSCIVDSRVRNIYPCEYRRKFKAIAVKHFEDDNSKSRILRMAVFIIENPHCIYYCLY